MTHALVGSYTEPGMGDGRGVSRLELGYDGLLGTVQGVSKGVRNPSFLALDADTLYAVEELAEGQLAELDPLTLEVRRRMPTLGSDPCHVVVHAGHVLAANYSSGTAAVLGTAAGDDAGDGAVYVLEHQGSGPVSVRQGSSHAHQTVPTPWGTVLVSDLGADRVDEYALASSGRYELLRSAELPPGTGPRHVVISGDFLLVAGELDAQLHVLRLVDDLWIWQRRVPMVGPDAPPSDPAPGVYPSHIELGPDGGKLYAAIRGSNTLAVFDVSVPEMPRLAVQVHSGGNWPRHFALGNNKVYVANQLSNNVAVFELDAHGHPGVDPVQTLEIGSPTCVVLVA
ncbi:lactonase family protein [Arthrobacter sp. ERGS1:01]|uniref:lactonase family protein n=1 Tax=Arthrobacter sp. ERGS1:01 TaxID=1704044 RepID=UPI0006B670B3|nr:beta-propeller fold lactonase family protein [Arthrobacter sp. ERGS1:01]